MYVVSSTLDHSRDLLLFMYLLFCVLYDVNRRWLLQVLKEPLLLSVNLAFYFFIFVFFVSVVFFFWMLISCCHNYTFHCLIDWYAAQKGETFSVRHCCKWSKWNRRWQVSFRYNHISVLYCYLIGTWKMDFLDLTILFVTVEHAALGAIFNFRGMYMIAILP